MLLIRFTHSISCSALSCSFTPSLLVIWLPYAYGRPDFRPGNTFFKTSEIRSSGEKPTVFASLSFGIVAGNYLSGKPVDPLISALFRPGVYGYRQKEKAP